MDTVTGDYCQFFAGLAKRWADGLLVGDAAALVRQHYTDDAILIPTMSNQPRISFADKVDYFVNFLANRPAVEFDSKKQEIAGDTAFDAGCYKFTFAADGSQTMARYTFIYRKIAGSWLAVCHHSSAFPCG